MFARLERLLTPGLLALACLACQGPSKAADPEPAPATLLEEPLVAATQEDHSAPETEAPGHGDHAAPGAPTDQPPNRDLHGPADTERYIRMLSSAQRVAELKPDLVAERIVEHTALAPDAVIADLGCGPGVFVWPLARQVPRGQVLAIDIEPRQLEAMSAGLVERGIENVVPVLATYESARIPPGGADVVFVADTYHHFDDRVAYFGRLRASIRPGGHLVLLEYKEGELPIGPPADHKVPLAERHGELEAAGFELVTSLSTHIWHDFEFWRLRRADN